jgi:hypothetical protein
VGPRHQAPKLAEIEELKATAEICEPHDAETAAFLNCAASAEIELMFG